MVPNKAKQGEKAGYGKSAWSDERKGEREEPGDDVGRLFEMIFISGMNYTLQLPGVWKSIVMAHKHS